MCTSYTHSASLSTRDSSRLDDAEWALKALDQSRKGTLSKDQMYQLMHQNLGVQKELGKVKKVVIG